MWIIFKSLTLLSLLLFLAAPLFWVRSYIGRGDVIAVIRFQRWALGSRQGMLVAENRFILSGAEWSTVSHGVPYSDHWKLEVQGELNSPAPMMANCTRYRGNRRGFINVGPVAWTDENIRYVAAPYWSVVCATLILPLTYIALLWIRRSAIAPGLCSTCGYDLRATPNCCPECGTVPKPAKV